MDNFFGSIYFEKMGREYVKAEKISQCGVYLINSLPGYVYCETNSQEIEITARKMGLSLDPITGEIGKGSMKILREQRNNVYPPRIRTSIEKLVDEFICTRLEEDDISLERLKIVTA